jgi:hypothetical protein
MRELRRSTRSRIVFWLWMILLIDVFGDAVSSFLVFALPYLRYDAEFLARFAVQQRFWLLSHIAGGSVALVLGPVQLWMGLNRRFMWIHRKTGMLYLISVALSSVGAFYLAATTRRGPVFGFALAFLGVAWVISTGLAYAAIWRRVIVQHQEWMIRSYVLTFTFVSFHMVVGILNYFEMGHRTEHINVASWLSWVVPLFLTEAIIQGRKIFAEKTAAASTLSNPASQGRSAANEMQTSVRADSQFSSRQRR